MFSLKRKSLMFMMGAFAASTALQSLNVSDAFAQATSQLSQGFVKGPGKRVSLTPKNNLEISSDETEIFGSLKGVVVVDAVTSVVDAGVNATGVETSSDVIPAGVIKAAEAYVGQPVSLASLDRMTRDMVIAFRNAGIPVVNVVVPPQDVTNSVVQILAVVGRVGKTTVEGDASNPEHYTADFPLEPGDVVSEEAVVNHLRWKSRRSHRRVDAIYSPGANFSETDIAFEVTETKPWSVFLGADSSGPGTSGEYRFFAGVIFNDLFKHDDEFSYQFSTSEEGTNGLAAHVLQYTLPVAKRADLQFTAAFVDSSSGNAVAGVTDGESEQLSVTYIRQLNRAFGFYWDGRIGFDYKSSDNSFEFGGGATTPGAQTDIGQFFGLVNGERVVGRKRTNVFAGIWSSPGDMFDNNDNAAFNAARAGATADYTYARLGIDHNVDFKNDWTLKLEAEGQISSDRLIASELFYLGGINTVRGFQENVVRGDSGIFASAELYTPVHEINKEGAGVKLRGFGFFDTGSVSVEGTPTVNEGNASISGAGIGISFATFDNDNPTSSIAGEVSYGWKVEDDVLNTRDTDDGQFHFRIISRF